MPLIPGLVSVTFRKLSTREIVTLCRQAGLEAIEWGGDVHVPPGNLNIAREVRRQTLDQGLRICSYGSYYRADPQDPDWQTVLNTAEILGAPNIRIWAGPKGSADTDAGLRRKIVQEIYNAADTAGSRNITVSLEYHGGTLTDTLESTRRLLSEVKHPNLFTYWQPAVTSTPDQREASLAELINQVTHVHVFQWVQGSAARLPLADGAAEWRRYLTRLAATGRTFGLLMEFVRDDSPEQFLADAAELQRWIAAL